MATILLKTDFTEISQDVIRIKKRRKDNKYTNYFKNFQYFYKELSNLNNTQLRDFTKHVIENCQVITIVSYNTDQAINIFNSLNGTGMPLTPIEIIVSKATEVATDRPTFEKNWEEIVSRANKMDFDLNNLVTQYIFVKLSEQQGNVTNPGIRKFFDQNKSYLKHDVQFTKDLNVILDNHEKFSRCGLGQIVAKFNRNFGAFIASFLFHRSNLTRQLKEEYIANLLRLGTLLELSEYSYGNRRFKEFLERQNLLYSQTNTVSVETLILNIKQHIEDEFTRDNVEEILTESGVSNSIVFLNEFLYTQKKQHHFDIQGPVDIEHIMPQSGLNRQNIIKDKGFAGESEFKEYVEKLGNKILLEYDINRSISDAWFESKRKYTIDDKGGYNGSKFSIAQALVHYDKSTWGKKDIENATIKAAKRVSDFIFE
ncbi:HNH endonuclease family protein [Lactiplantibacillus carotarum]|uniref:HNH endonuclease family protein n=1 Tax=Lactiplantibacillus carotarum TaxID=2993456 RepID=UPI00298F2458|nr:HNH endonuclease family protein [Lactiplantibacillus carotarum]